MFLIINTELFVIVKTYLKGLKFTTIAMAA